MGKYGEIALLAVKLIELKQVTIPQEAWEKASTKLFGAVHMDKEMDVPKGHLLGLYEEGFVRGIRQLYKVTR